MLDLSPENSGKAGGSGRRESSIGSSSLVYMARLNTRQGLYAINR